MDHRDWLVAERHRHVAAIERIDEQLAALGGRSLPTKTPAAIRMLLEEVGVELRISHVVTKLRENGRDVLEPAVAQALFRLARAGKIERTGHGWYKAKSGGPR